MTRGREESEKRKGTSTGTSTRLLEAIGQRNPQWMKILSAALIGALVSMVVGMGSTYALFLRHMITREEFRAEMSQHEAGAWARDRGEIRTRLQSVERGLDGVNDKLSVLERDIRSDLKAIREGLTKLTIEVGVLQKKIDSSE